MRGYVVDPDGSLTDEPGIKAGRSSTSGSLTVIESRTRGGAPAHVHERQDEAMYVLEGAIRGRFGDVSFEAGPRSFVFLPRGLVHEWDVVGEEAVVLIITSPAGLEGFLREFHEAEEGRAEIARRHGIEFR